jgi:hypothetical protein
MMEIIKNPKTTLKDAGLGTGRLEYFMSGAFFVQIKTYKV